MTDAAATRSEADMGRAVGLTRADDTEVEYRRRFGQLWNDHLASPDVPTPPLTAFARWLVARRVDLAPSSFRQYRAASRFVIGERARSASSSPGKRDDCLSADAVLQDSIGASPARPSKPIPRTAARKAKLVFAEDWDRLMERLNASRSRHAPSVRLLLQAGLCTGLRPAEWLGASLAYDDAVGEWHLRLHNGKCRNGRAHGTMRTQHWRDAGPEVAAVRAWLDHLTDILPAGEAERRAAWDASYDGWRECLRRTCEKLWPRRTRLPTLYTTRHMFKAIGSLRFDRAEIAALLGHASDRTASIHYARSPKGGKRLPTVTLPAPCRTEVARVRQEFEAKESRAAYRQVDERRAEPEGLLLPNIDPIRCR